MFLKTEYIYMDGRIETRLQKLIISPKCLCFASGAVYSEPKLRKGEEVLVIEYRPCSPHAPQAGEEPQTPLSCQALEDLKCNCIALLPRGNQEIKSLQNYAHS